MKKLTLILAMLCLSIASTMGQGRIILVPSGDYTVTEDHTAASIGLAIGVSGINESSLTLGLNQKRFIDGEHKDYTSLVLSGTVFPFNNGFGFNAKGFMSRGEYLSDAIQGDPIICECTGKIKGYEPDYRTSTQRTKLFGSVGAVFRYQQFRLSGDVNINDYNANEWLNNSGNPYKVESYKVGLAYVIPLKSFIP